MGTLGAPAPEGAEHSLEQGRASSGGAGARVGTGWESGRGHLGQGLPSTNRENLFKTNDIFKRTIPPFPFPAFPPIFPLLVLGSAYAVIKIRSKPNASLIRKLRSSILSTIRMKRPEGSWAQLPGTGLQV